MNHVLTNGHTLFYNAGIINNKQIMVLNIRNSSKLIVLALVLMSVFSCKSHKKAMEASNAAAEKAKIEREAAERKLKADEQARQADDKAKWEAEQQRLKESESERKTSTPAVKLSQYFNSIASSGNATSANTSINEALTLFASSETPVLIVISDSGSMKDYDKPTTIKDYLNYLKDQKKNINSISNFKTDSDGKITELELKKN